MTTFEARVSFYDTREPATAAVVSVSEEELAIAVGGQSIGRWPIDKLSPALLDEALVIWVEGERLLIEVSNLDVLVEELRLPASLTQTVTPLAVRRGGPVGGLATIEDSQGRGRHVAHREPGIQTTNTGASLGVSIDLRTFEDPIAESSDADVIASLRKLRDLETALAIAQTQLRWVTDLVPRRLPISTRADETGLGAVEGVQLKERRSPARPDGTQPWMVVDSGNVYVSDRRLLFAGDREIDFYFDDIERKGASTAGLLLGVSSRPRSHILAGPGERLAVVLTAAEKIARGLEPTLPFREVISRLMGHIDAMSVRLQSVSGMSRQDYTRPFNTA